MPRIYDMRMHDGSRHFAGLPETKNEYAMRDHVAKLAGATLTGFVTDDVTEAWIDFAFRGHAFSINNQNGDWWFFVTDPGCPEEVLEAVVDHFEELLDPQVPAWAREHAAPPGMFRVVVLEADARVTWKEFPDPSVAARYADDAAWEAEEGPVYAVVLDDASRLLHRGGAAR
jgi:hypothetical protein